METLLNTYIASLPTIATKHKINVHDNLRTKGKLPIKVEKYLVSKATVLINFYGDALWSHNSQMNLNALEYVLSSILRKRITEEKSDVCAVNIKNAFSRLRNQYSTKISFTCDPNRIEELVVEVHKLVDTLKMRHTNNRYIDNYIAQKLTTREIQLTTNAFWKYYLQWNADIDYQQLGLNEFILLVDSINKLKVKDAANSYLNIDDSLTAI
jgi:zinc protease